MADKCLYFIHVIKTGGTSVRRFFHENNIPNFDLYTWDHCSYSENKFKKLKKKYKDIISMICLRDPVKQLLSFYSYILNNPSVEIYKFTKDKTFGQWIRGIPDFKNYYVRYLNFDDYYFPNNINNFRYVKNDLKLAINTLNKIDYVISTQNLTYYLNIILKQENINNIFNYHRNKSNSNKFSVSADDINYIKNIRYKDYELLEKFNIPLIY